MNKKASLSIYFALMVGAIIVILIAAVFAPMGVLFNEKMYSAGEDIILMANESVADINAVDVRSGVYSLINEGLAAQQNNIDINANIFKYGWILVISLTALVVFLFTRRLTEVNRGMI